eukprot:CAMPEP_0174275226 /NCGR_PEP_ID=MMETSP0439-20130205/59539_1 /TAXON_ID=0 /ORGANISM="Stereomyxa ramosa, Strain Chinc5" /LENGTH=194 /DNA_ID=CAMNT_0015367311 /DNA_START=30 /DNA_END=614 /DNA_ORIENTATION=+
MGNTHGIKLSKREKEEWIAKYGLPKDKAERTIKAFKTQMGKDKQISKDKFIAVMTEQGAADQEFAEAIFHSFDKDESGTIDIHEYMALMGVSFGGDTDEKLKASFELFDEDGNGELDREEVERMLTLVMKSMMRRASPPGTKIEISEKRKAEINRIINEIFEKVDVDHNGTIDIDEFKEGFKEHPDICNFFKQF